MNIMQTFWESITHMMKSEFSEAADCKCIFNTNFTDLHFLNLTTPEKSLECSDILMDQADTIPLFSEHLH